MHASATFDAKSGFGANRTTDFYQYDVVRLFALAAVLWGVVGMLVGVVLAAQLVWPDLTFGIPWLSYGRLRPLHTNAVIFAFGGCSLFATSFIACSVPATPACSRRHWRCSPFWAGKP
jgi:cytochrome c oxidase cbb3-type subunit 1